MRSIEFRSDIFPRLEAGHRYWLTVMMREPGEEGMWLLVQTQKQGAPEVQCSFTHAKDLSQTIAVRVSAEKTTSSREDLRLMASPQSENRHALTNPKKLPFLRRFTNHT